MSKKKKEENTFKPKKVDTQISKKKSSTTPTEWDIVIRNKKQFLTFYNKETVLAEVPLTPDYLNDLMTELNNYIIVDDNIADSWTFRQPLEEGQPEYLTILNEGKILGTLPIDETTGKKLGNKLSRYTKKPTVIQSINIMRKAKPKRFYVLAFFTVITAGVILYGILANILDNFGLTIPIF